MAGHTGHGSLGSGVSSVGSGVGPSGHRLHFGGVLGPIQQDLHAKCNANSSTNDLLVIIFRSNIFEKPV